MLVPLTPTEKAVLLPLHADTFDGCEVIAGAEFTDRVAALEVAAGEQAPLTTQRYW